MKPPKILKLRPTQFVLGMKEVEAKINKIKNFSNKEWGKYAHEHVVPVVIGWDKECYLVDHHHFIRACWETRQNGYEIQVLKDLSHLGERAFWKQMVKNGWTYLHDQFGRGPHAPQDLPMDIRCMADDPYRSLVWSVIDQDGIVKQTLPFFEFQWAEYFRKNMKCDLHSKSDFKASIKRALKLAAGKGASHLPGFKHL